MGSRHRSDTGHKNGNLRYETKQTFPLSQIYQLRLASLAYSAVCRSVSQYTIWEFFVMLLGTTLVATRVFLVLFPLFKIYFMYKS